MDTRLPQLKNMKQKLLIAFVILLASVFVLCLAYAAALRAKQAELATTVPQGSTLVPESETTGKETVPEKQSQPLETTASGIAKPTETIPPDTTAATQATEPTQEEIQPSTQETTAATEESMDPNELPIIPNV